MFYEFYHIFHIRYEYIHVERNGWLERAKVYFALKTAAFVWKATSAGTKSNKKLFYVREKKLPSEKEEKTTYGN